MGVCVVFHGRGVCQSHEAREIYKCDGYEGWLARVCYGLTEERGALDGEVASVPFCICMNVGKLVVQMSDRLLSKS